MLKLGELKRSLNVREQLGGLWQRDLHKQELSVAHLVKSQTHEINVLIYECGSGKKKTTSMPDFNPSEVTSSGKGLQNICSVYSHSL